MYRIVLYVVINIRVRGNRGFLGKLGSTYTVYRCHGLSVYPV